MKLAAGEVPALLAAPPPSLSAILLYGPDEGLVRERAAAATAGVLGPQGDDPFRLTVLTGEAVRADEARLADEAEAQSLIGGRRVVRVREAGDALAKPLARLLGGRPTAALMVIEAGDLAARSSLRKLAEEAKTAAAIACYPDGPKELAALVRATLASRRVTIDEEATQYLVQNLGADRAISRQELEKLALSVGDGGRVGLDAALASIGDNRALDLEEAVYDTFDGLTLHAESILDRLLREGETPVGLVRALQRHAHRLHLASSKLAGGQSADDIVRSLRLYFRYQKRFQDQLYRWPRERIEQLLAVLTEAELNAKSTGLPDEALCRRLLHAVARIRVAAGR